jgi:DNA-binding IclR family transcriptional regulator
MEQEERIPTNLRMLLIMEVVGESGDPISPAEIGRRIGLPKQTIHRLCNTLVKEGFLVHDPAWKGLRPGQRGRNMASSVLSNSRDHMARHQVLMGLSRAVGETVNFVMPEDDGMSYRDRVETDWALRIQLPIGTHVPFHCTASGKVFLASLPKKAREKMLLGLELPPLTPHSITEKKQLETELDKISKQGYALDEGEFMEGMTAIAVPVLDPTNRFHAALAVHGPDQRLTKQTAIARTDLLTDAAKRLSQTIFG